MAEDTHTNTQDNYRNPRCACAPRVNHNPLPSLSLSPPLPPSPSLSLPLPPSLSPSLSLSSPPLCRAWETLIQPHSSVQSSEEEEWEGFILVVGVAKPSHSPVEVQGIISITNSKLSNSLFHISVTVSFRYLVFSRDRRFTRPHVTADYYPLHTPRARWLGAVHAHAYDGHSTIARSRTCRRGFVKASAAVFRCHSVDQ